MWLTADIGGTKLAAAAWNGRNLSTSSCIPTLSQEGSARVIKRLIGLLSETAEKEKLDSISGIGIACPGSISASNGVVVKAPNLGWENVPIAEILFSHFGCRVVLENDANAAALGEYIFGAGSDSESMAYITVSTGVGCGIILNGKVWKGAHEAAGELGHITLYKNGRKCSCGCRGCLQQYASGTAIGESATRILHTRGIKRTITAKEAAELARQGDTDMQSVFYEAGQDLGKGIAALLKLMDLQRIVIGGSVAQAFDLLKEGIQNSVRSNCFWKENDKWLVKAQLNGNSGLWGAGILISAADLQAYS